MNSVTTSTKVLTAVGMLALQALGASQAPAMEAEPTQAAEGAIAAEKTARGTVAKAVFTTAVVDGQPTDFRSEIETSVPKVFFYTVLEGMMDQTVSHRWKYQGKVMAVAKIDVKNDPDKVWSSNEMRPEWTGAWEVEVVDGSGQVIDSRTFAFEAPL
jgi:hypothetical protein